MTISKYKSGPGFYSVMQEAFSHLSGLPCWGISLQAETWLKLNFGDPYLVVTEPKVDAIATFLKKRRVSVLGEFSLCLWECAWMIAQGDIMVDVYGSDAGALDSALRLLEGQILTSVSLATDPLVCSFRFDLGSTLKVTPPRDGDCDDEDLWTLYDDKRDISFDLIKTGILIKHLGENEWRFPSESVAIII